MPSLSGSKRFGPSWLRVTVTEPSITHIFFVDEGICGLSDEVIHFFMELELFMPQ
jgi:hypothetical protein